MKRTHWLVRAVTSGAVVLTLVACSGTTGTTKPSRAQATDPLQGAEERWELLVSKRYSEAYDYLSPGFRSATTREEYAQELSNRPVSWVKAKVLEKTCPSEEECKVSVSVVFRTKAPAAPNKTVEIPSTVTEQWLRISGGWYHVPKTVAR